MYRQFDFTYKFQANKNFTVYFKNFNRKCQCCLRLAKWSNLKQVCAFVSLTKSQSSVFISIILKSHVISIGKVKFKILDADLKMLQ